MVDADTIDEYAGKLEATCRERHQFISGDGRIGEEVAAELLGLAIGTMRNNRSEGSGPPYFRLGGGGHKVTYALRDLAAWILSFRSTP